MTYPIRNIIVGMTLALLALKSATAADEPFRCKGPFKAPQCFGAVSTNDISLAVQGVPRPVVEVSYSALHSSDGESSHTALALLQFAPIWSLDAFGQSTSTAVSRLNQASTVGESMASANMASGELKARVSGNGQPGKRVDSFAEASLNDVLTFSAPIDLTEFSISVSMSIAGTIDTTAGAGPSATFLEGYSQGWITLIGPQTSAKDTTSSVRFYDTGSVSKLLSRELVIARPRGAVGDNWVSQVAVTSGLRVQSTKCCFISLSPSTFDIDFSNTATVMLQVSDGVTYSSASGSFLVSAVPEPSTWAMFAAAGILLFVPRSSGRRGTRTMQSSWRKRFSTKDSTVGGLDNNGPIKPSDERASLRSSSASSL